MLFFWVLLILCGILQANTGNITSLDGFFFPLLEGKCEVCTKVGCIQGKEEKGRLKPYEAFYGIPYAEPPVGPLRFENPIPFRGWTKFWNATYPRADCLQRNHYIVGQPIVGSEDCLYLNIYRPIRRIVKLPVLVFIHGGAWLSSSSNPAQYGPEYLMDNGEVILVTLNYRLGMFGFLCSGDKAVKGNFGLKDQQLALKWIASNIFYFGGNPTSITLAGQSVGSMSVNLHMMNPMSQGLFHRAIMMSGPAISSFMDPIDFPAQFRASANFSGIKNSGTASTEKLAKQLKYIDGIKLILAEDQLFAFPGTPPGPMRPCVEGDWDGAFMTEDPRKVWADGTFSPKPLLIGTVGNEGSLSAPLLLNQTILKAFNDNIYQLLPIQLGFPPRYASAVMKYYFGEKDYIDESNAQDYYRLCGDRLVVYPTIKLVNQFLGYVDVQKNPVFVYEFNFTSSYTFLKYVTGLDINVGVGHRDDLFYLFTMTSLFPPFKPDSPEGKMTDIWVRTIVNFVARGEVKVWRTFIPCTSSTSTPFCDRQIFQRYEEPGPNPVVVSVSDHIDEGMYRLWLKIDDSSNF